MATEYILVANPDEDVDRALAFVLGDETYNEITDVEFLEEAVALPSNACVDLSIAPEFLAIIKSVDRDGLYQIANSFCLVLCDR